MPTRTSKASKPCTTSGSDGRAFDVLAVRGERLGLARWALTDGGGNEIAGLALTELSTDGRTQALIWFDADDLDAAFHELDARFADGEGANASDAIRFAERAARAQSERDWDTFRSFMADDMTYVDHRPMSSGRMGPDECIEYARLLAGMSSSYRADIQRYFAMTNDRAVLQVRNTGASVEGVEFELVFLAVTWLRGGQLASARALLSRRARYGPRRAMRNSVLQRPPLAS